MPLPEFSRNGTFSFYVIRLLVCLLDQVECGTGLEPCPLLFVVGVVERHVFARAILVVDDERERLAWSEFGETHDIEHILFLNLVVVGSVLEGEGEHALLLEVRFVNTGETLHNHGLHAEETRFHSGVFTGWSDGVKDATRSIEPESGLSVTAEFK